MYRKPALKTASPGVSSANHTADQAEDTPRPTSEMLAGKRFRFSWKTENGGGNHGILSFNANGTLSGGTGSPNETFWTIDEQGRLVFKRRDGRVSTIFTRADQQSGKWFFSGPYQFSSGVAHLLEEVDPEKARALENQMREVPNQKTVEHSENLNKPEDQAWLAWAKKLPISANPLPQINDRNEGLALKDFSNYPLFGPKGPSEDDVFQGDGGDCNFLARLAGLAAAHPDFIRKVVNDVGDGTYVVHYWRLQNHEQFVIRVNSELWVNSSGRPKYAQIGPDRAIWPAILEKVFALTRRPPYNYQATFGGDESICYIPVDWGFQPPLDESLPEPFSPEVVAGWFNNGVSNCPNKHELFQSNKWVWFNSGAPHGPIRDAVFSCAIQRLKWFKAQLDVGTVVVVGAAGRLNNDTPVIPPNPVEIKRHLLRTDTYWTNHQHEYTVVRVPIDKNGEPIGVVLRNPGGPIRHDMIGRHYLILDYARVYFCLEHAIYIRPCNSIQFLPPSLEKATSQ